MALNVIDAVAAIKRNVAHCLTPDSIEKLAAPSSIAGVSVNSARRERFTLFSSRYCMATRPAAILCAWPAWIARPKPIAKPGRACR
jgi:hypothetical protein